MLESFFTQIKVRSRMESGPIGPYLSEIAALLHRNGYARSTIRRHLRAADRFGAWILKEGMSIVDINASVVDRYLEGLGRQFFPSRLGGTLPDKASGLRQMVEMLSQEGVLRPDAKEQPPIGIARCEQTLTITSIKCEATRLAHGRFISGMLGDFCLSVSEPRNLTGRR